MRRMPWATYLWPGLGQLCERGGWLALAEAVAAAFLLNVTLVCTFVWSETITPDLRTGLWLFVAATWLIGAILAIVGSARKETDGLKDNFSEVLQHYLKGDWFQTERLLLSLLRKNARDLEAHLMMATLLRHTARVKEAAEQLDLLVRLDGAEKWELEIRRERELLDHPESENDDPLEETTGPKASDPPEESTLAA